MRRALAVLCLALAPAPAMACAIDPYSQSAYPASLALDLATRGQIARAWFDGPSEIYDHRILGRDTEPTRLYAQFPPGSSDCGSAIQAGEGHVFEDIAPRLADLNGDGENEVTVVRTSVRKGAQLAVYGARGDGFGLIATTPYIGRAHRWLAPAGIADFDGDGRVEVAYVDRPHLVAELVFVRLQGGALREVARLPGVTNHRIGEEFISGGLRDCGQGPELVAASPDWSRLLVIGWAGGKAGGPVARDAGGWSRSAAKDALACR